MEFKELVDIVVELAREDTSIGVEITWTEPNQSISIIRKSILCKANYIVSLHKGIYIVVLEKVYSDSNNTYGSGFEEIYTYYINLLTYRDRTSQKDLIHKAISSVDNLCRIKNFDGPPHIKDNSEWRDSIVSSFYNSVNVLGNISVLLESDLCKSKVICTYDFTLISNTIRDLEKESRYFGEYRPVLVIEYTPTLRNKVGYMYSGCIPEDKVSPSYIALGYPIINKTVIDIPIAKYALVLILLTRHPLRFRELIPSNLFIDMKLNFMNPTALSLVGLIEIDRYKSLNKTTILYRFRSKKGDVSGVIGVEKDGKLSISVDGSVFIYTTLSKGLFWKRRLIKDIINNSFDTLERRVINVYQKISRFTCVSESILIIKEKKFNVGVLDLNLLSPGNQTINIKLIIPQSDDITCEYNIGGTPKRISFSEGDIIEVLSSVISIVGFNTGIDYRIIESIGI